MVADVGRQEGESCVGVGEELELRGVVWTWKQGGRTTTGQRVMLRELIFKAKNEERKKFCENLEREDEKGNLFRVAKQLVKRNRDVVGANCVKDRDMKVVVEEDRLMEIWRTQYDVLSNEEFAWDREGLTKCKFCEWA